MFMKKKRKLSQLLSLLLVFMLTATSVMPVSAAGEESAKERTMDSGIAKNCSAKKNVYAIYPIPQSIDYGAGGEFTLDEAAIVVGAGVDDYTVAFLKEVLDKYGVAYSEEGTEVRAGKTNIMLGINGQSDAVSNYIKDNNIASANDLFDKTDAYMLDASEAAIVISGKDADSVFYGVATLQMMLSSFENGRLLNAHIEDYASVATRGYIEGFYGAWTFEERENLMRSARDYKMNSYVYAAKGDEYHKNTEPYPDDMLASLQRLVEVGKETKVEFGWSIHLSAYFKELANYWNNDTKTWKDESAYNTKFNELTTKLTQLYNIGVRKFDVLSDDFGGGPNDMVVVVLNRLNKEFIQAKDCEPMAYCPQGYNKAWSGSGAELESMKNLDDDITIYWTGDDVNAPITQETVTFLTEKTGHKPDFWLNYPVNEHAKSGIYLGDITHYARDGVTGMSGFHSNPSRFAYSNEVGLYQLAALVWNNKDFVNHANEIWLSAFDYLQPEVEEAYRTIAKNVSNCPGSGRVPQGFNESEYIAEKLAEVQTLIDSGATLKDNEAVAGIKAEFQNMLKAVETFRAECANQDLVSELEPWLKSLTDLATAGQAALESLIALEGDDVAKGWNQLSLASKSYDTMYTYPTTSDSDLQGVYAKAGSKRLEPLVKKAINSAKNKLTPILNPGDNSFVPTIYAQLGGNAISDDANAKKMYDGDESTAAAWNTDQVAGDYYGLDLGRVITVKDVSILQGNSDTDHDIFHDAVLQYSENGIDWQNIDAAVEGNRVSASGLDVKARFVRYYLNATGTESKENYWTHVREFTVNKADAAEVAERDRIYTNIADYRQTPLTISGAELSVRNLDNITLNQGEYIGIRLANPTRAAGFVNNCTDNSLTFEYSYNEADWTAVPTGNSDDIAIKYIRLANHTGSAVTTDINKIGMVTEKLQATPSVLEHNLNNALKEGSFENMFDGDYSTYAWTNEGQVKDQYLIVDLGDYINVHDVQIVTSDGKPRLYEAEISISSDKNNWTPIATVENDNSVFEVPYRYVRGDGQGQNARYLRILITKTPADNPFLCIQEIEVNKNATSDNAADVFDSNLSGSFGNITDNDISTLFSANVEAGSYLQYNISENTNVESVSFVLGAANTGKVYAVTADGEKKELGTLSDTVVQFDTSTFEDVIAVRVEWDAEEEVSIHEMILSKGEYITDDVGEFVEPDIDDVETPAESVNVALGKDIAASGSQNGNVETNANDDDDNSRWDSPNITKDGAAGTQTAWIYVDLGEEKQYEVSRIVAKYFNKAYPTEYDVQISDGDGDLGDNASWRTVKTVTHASNETPHKDDEILLDEVFTARYVRLYFHRLNNVAAGNIALEEFEIYGIEKITADKEPLMAAIAKANTMVESKDYTVASKAALEAAIATATGVLETATTDIQITEAVAALQGAVDALQKKVTEQQNIGLNKPVEVSGTSNGVKESINDADVNSKWDSQFIKGSNKESDEAWFVIDLGEQTNRIEQLNVQYFNKVYPTQYKVQISNDNTNWTTVEVLTREHNGDTYPLDEIAFEQPISARYIKMLFTEMNSAAAGNGVGITNTEVLGRYVYETSEVASVNAVPSITVEKDSEFDAGQLPETIGIQISVAELDSNMSLAVPVAWDTTSLDMTKAGTYTLPGTLSLDGISNTEGYQASLNVIVESDEPPVDPLDFEELDKQLAIAAEKAAEESRYTPASYSVFKGFYESALAAKENATTQEAINTAASELETAIAGLKDKANKDSLQAEIDKGAAIVEEKDIYTETSYAAFEAAYNAAVALMDNDDASQDAVDGAVVLLAEKIGLLEKKPENPSTKPDDSSANQPKASDTTVKTGDAAPVELILLLFVVSGSILLVFSAKKKVGR